MFAGALDTLQFQKSIQWDLVLLVADREAFPISKTVIEDYLCVYSFIHYLHACPNMSKSNFHNYNFRVALARFFSWKQCKAKKTLCRFRKVAYMVADKEKFFHLSL